VADVNADALDKRSIASWIDVPGVGTHQERHARGVHGGQRRRDRLAELLGDLAMIKGGLEKY
jgi:hypothetical protein